MPIRRHQLRVTAIVLLVAATVLACNLAAQTTAADSGPTLPPSDTPPPPATSEPPTVEVVTPEITETATPIVHTNIPGEPPGAARYMTDRSSLPLAQEARSIADDFSNGVFERPFTSQSMEYKPYLDITRGEISASVTWVYVTLFVEGQALSAEPAFYGVEFDLDLDGRGDWLILGAAPPTTEWTTDGVQAYQDTNDDVGALTPVRADPPPQVGDQYETLVFDQGVGPDPDAAWIRRSPTTPNNIQIALKAGLIGGDNELLWGVWTFSDPQPSWIDYQDHFTIEQAGSPLIENSNYPLKELALIDSSCRWGFDFTPVGNEPGVCRVPPSPTPTLVCTRTLPQNRCEAAGGTWRQDPTILTAVVFYCDCSG